MPVELCIAILPSSDFELEWCDADGAVSKDQVVMQKEFYRRYEIDLMDALLFLGFSDTTVPLSVSLTYWRQFTGYFCSQLVKTPELETLRHNVTIELDDADTQRWCQTAPFMPGSEYLTSDILQTLWTRLNQAYQGQIKAFSGSVETFIGALSSKVHLVGRVFFHLVESKQEETPFAFLATYSTGLNEKGQSKHLPLKHALAEYGNNSRQLLELLGTVYEAATESDFIAEILETGEIFHPLALTANEAYSILQEINFYEQTGILCRIPNWWKNKAVSVQMNIRVGNDQPTSLGTNSLLDFNVHLALGDDVLSEQEIETILAESDGLALIKGKWVEVNHDRLEQTLAAYQRAKSLMDEGGLSLRDAMRLQLTNQSGATLTDENIEISHGKWLQTVLSKLHHPEKIKAIRPPKTFKANLRPYQKEGLSWLCFLNSLQIGACLADDMGLGKTVQLLAMMTVLKAKAANNTPAPRSLLIIPASLIGNWLDEIKRFAPKLAVFLAHPSGHSDREILQNGPALEGHDLVITTYGLCQRYDWLGQREWDMIILDEAQAIKNPGTKQTRAVKSLRTKHRIAMTGTPIENRLSDLWSLFDFLNPGLLGSAREFSQFVKGLKHNPQGYTNLKQVVSPYILRRLKTDKHVIADLPDKVESKTYATLSKKQVVLYKKLVLQIKETLATTDEGIQRKGLVLGALTKFKQLCNHPDQYLGQGDYAESHSGKFERLRSICETIHEKREKVLVFTQFKEIIPPLDHFLREIFGHEGLVLHGSTAVKKRRTIVEEFQSKGYIPYMILSIKAGGVGLNLTAANHVIHFDRWWNPAVENQATDRAFRIGQHKNVMVHKFMTQGTIEEKIDKMLDEKSELSHKIVPTAKEAWITEMNNQDLMKLFTLSL